MSWSTIRPYPTTAPFPKLLKLSIFVHQMAFLELRLLNYRRILIIIKISKIQRYHRIKSNPYFLISLFLSLTLWFLPPPLLSLTLSSHLLLTLLPFTPSFLSFSHLASHPPPSNLFSIIIIIITVWFFHHFLLSSVSSILCYLIYANFK